MKYKAIQFIAYFNEFIKLRFTNIKIWISIGDSLTKPCMYQTLVNYNSEMRIINRSVGGSTLSDNGQDIAICKRVLRDLPKSADIITLMAGTNDFSQNVKIGLINSSDVTTFYGALNFVVKTLLENYPSTRIILLSPPKLVHQRHKSVNKNGNRIEDYAFAIEQVAYVYGIEYIDVCNQSGINETNIKSYTLDGVHLNIKGHKKIAKILKDRLVNKSYIKK